MPATYEPIATTTLGSNAATITLSSIPNTYTDLKIILVGSITSGWPYLQFNTDTGSNYSSTVVQGQGTGASSSQVSNATYITFSGANALGTGMFTDEIDVFSYAGSTNKTCLIANSADANGSGWVNRTVGLWRSTSAINQIVFKVSGSGNYTTGTTATLYGIKAA